MEEDLDGGCFGVLISWLIERKIERCWVVLFRWVDWFGRLGYNCEWVLILENYFDWFMLDFYNLLRMFLYGFGWFLCKGKFWFVVFCCVVRWVLGIRIFVVWNWRGNGAHEFLFLCRGFLYYWFLNWWLKFLVGGWNLEKIQNKRRN